MITKKDIPFELLSSIDPIAQENLDIIKLKKEENTYYSFIETDDKSSNYFKIYIDGAPHFAAKVSSGPYVCEWKPANENRSKRLKLQGSASIATGQFKKWITLIRRFNDTPSLHDDNFLNKYTDYYFSEFKILDDDANLSPFNPDQQDFIELELNHIESIIIEPGQSLPEPLLLEIKKDIGEIKNNLPNSTKNQVMKNISIIFGKLYIHSKHLAKNVAGELKKRMIKTLVEKGIKYSDNIATWVQNYLDGSV